MFTKAQYLARNEGGDDYPFIFSPIHVILQFEDWTSQMCSTIETIAKKGEERWKFAESVRPLGRSQILLVFYQSILIVESCRCHL